MIALNDRQLGTIAKITWKEVRQLRAQREKVLHDLERLDEEIAETVEAHDALRVNCSDAFTDRLKKTFGSTKPGSVARALQVRREQVLAWLNGTEKPDEKTIDRICGAFGVDRSWLTGSKRAASS